MTLPVGRSRDCASWIDHPHIAANVAAQSLARADYGLAGHRYATPSR